MAKSKSTPAQSILSPIIEGVKKNIIDTFNAMVQEKIRKLEKMGVEIATGFVFFAFGIFFMLMALVFGFREFAQWSYFWSFFGTGIIALLVCFIIYEMLKKN